MSRVEVSRKAIVLVLLTSLVSVASQRNYEGQNFKPLEFDFLFCITDGVVGYTEESEHATADTFNRGDVIYLTRDIWQKSRSHFQIVRQEPARKDEIVFFRTEKRSDFIYLGNQDLLWIDNNLQNEGDLLNAISNNQTIGNGVQIKAIPKTVKIYRDHSSHSNWLGFSDKLTSLQTLIIERDINIAHRSGDESRVLQLLDSLILNYPKDKIYLTGDRKGTARKVSQKFKTDIFLSQGDALVALGDYSGASKKYDQALNNKRPPQNQYFSIGGVVHADYQRRSSRLNELIQSLQNQKAEKHVNRYWRVYHGPEYYFDRYIMIPRGMHVQKISNNTNKELGTVTQFNYTVTDMNDGIFFETERPDESDGNVTDDLYLISENPLKDVRLIETTVDENSDDVAGITEQLLQYFDTNRAVVTKQLKYTQTSIDLSLNSTAFKASVDSLLEFTVRSCPPESGIQHIVQARLGKYSLHMLYIDMLEADPRVLSSSSFLNLFTIDNQPYLFTVAMGEGGPGVNVQRLFRIRDGKLEEVFAEGFWST